VLFALLAMVGLVGPKAWLSGRADKRVGSMERELPDVLDLMTISVEAGLGLEAAIQSVCDDFSSPLSEELARTLQEMNLGLSRQQALENLRARTEVEDLNTFIVVLTQADLLGMPIGRVLRTQADQMRERRRGRAREKAAKLPVKILFPLMMFILPPLMIVVMGPAVAGLISAFSQNHL
jgi:tight adherence protein C